MHPRIRTIGREVVSFGLIALVLLAARSTLADHYTVPSGSMEYTLLPGDRIFVSKYTYGFRFPFTDWKLTEGREVERGEVVVFDSPVEDIRLVKRIVAVGGDTVSIRGGQVSINGAPMSSYTDMREEHYGERRVRLNLSYSGGEDYGPEIIPPGTSWPSETPGGTARTDGSSVSSRRTRSTAGPCPSTTAATKASAG